MIIECIPDYRQSEEWADMADKYGLAFEYNEFFNPEVLEDKDLTEKIIGVYEGLGRDTSNDTLHGAFLDITIHSSDPLIRNASDYRVRQSLDIASRLNCRGVVFHTNYLTDFKSIPYRKNWVDINTMYWDKLCSEYKNINIYLENMFDESPELLADVAENLKQVDNFGVCFDIAHAFLSNVPLDTWTGALTPNIKHIHINDNDKLQDLHLAVGSGQIDWSILKNKELFAASPSLLIEVSGMDRLLSSYQFLESINFFE